MKINKRIVYSLVLMTTVIASSLSPVLAFDEGMFAPNQIATLPLKKLGLKIRPEEVYNPAGGGLSDAIVRLSWPSGGCTGEFVSAEGLILTNHHCGFDGLVTSSTTENDLVETGFKASNRAGEFSAKGYSIIITERVDDVTAKVRAGTDNLTGDELMKALTANAGALQKAEQDKAPKGSTIRIQMLDNGYYFYQYQTRQLKDIRVVYVPPRNIGVFGGDPDNFEWTRHTGDFSILRAYTAPDGTAADYSPNNVPYKPKKFLTISLNGLKENDFVFVMGYPGSTTRYREASSIAYARDASYPFLAAWLRARSDALKLIGQTDEEKRIELQSDIASFDNAFKVYDGGAVRLKLANVVEQRQAEETQFAKWIAQDPTRQKKYGNVLSEIASLTADANKYAKRDAIVARIPEAGMGILAQIYAAATQKTMLTDAQRQVKYDEIQKALPNREPIYEREMLKFFLRAFADLPADQKFDWAEQYFKDKGNRRAAETKFATDIAEGKYWNAETLAALYGPQTTEYRPERDDPRSFAIALAKEKEAAAARAGVFAGKIAPLRLLYEQGIAEMTGKPHYPDANSTLRFSYGYVKGYVPREAEVRTPFTTMKGMWEKDTGVNPFDMPQKLKDLQTAKDFGRYGEGDSVVVNFLSTNDIIGGNSGSPVLNAYGEQVGIVFDGNYEGLGNGFFYDTVKNRTISVDIRFVLFVTEKFGGAKWVVDEMKIAGEKARAATR
jgi:hypothetical protein